MTLKVEIYFVPKKKKRKKITKYSTLFENMFFCNLKIGTDIIGENVIAEIILVIFSFLISIYGKFFNFQVSSFKKFDYKTFITRR